MSQKHKIEVLVTERNCPEFGEGESPSKIAEKRNRETTSCPFSSSSCSSFFFYSALSKENNIGIFLDLPIGRSLVLAFPIKTMMNKPGPGQAPSLKAHPELVLGSCRSQGAQFNSGLTAAPWQSCLSALKPLSLFPTHSRK